MFKVLVLQIAATVNAQVTGKNMAFNPTVLQDNDIFHHQFSWQNALESTMYEELKTNIKKRINTAINMSDIENTTVQFNENAYDTTKFRP